MQLVEATAAIHPPSGSMTQVDLYRGRGLRRRADKIDPFAKLKCQDRRQPAPLLLFPLAGTVRHGLGVRHSRWKRQGSSHNTYRSGFVACRCAENLAPIRRLVQIVRETALERRA